MVYLLRYSNQLNVEDERGATGDAWLGEFAVAHLCRNVEFPLVTDVHLLKGDDPSVNQVAESHSNRGCRQCSYRTSCRRWSNQCSER